MQIKKVSFLFIIAATSGNSTQGLVNISSSHIIRRLKLHAFASDCTDDNQYLQATATATTTTTTIYYIYRL